MRHFRNSGSRVFQGEVTTPGRRSSEVQTSKAWQTPAGAGAAPGSCARAGVAREGRSEADKQR